MVLVRAPWTITQTKSLATLKTSIPTNVQRIGEGVNGHFESFVDGVKYARSDLNSLLVT
jgi:hypothetical protein